ncbi:glycosyltransferase family 25 protein [Sphingobium sp. BS19]|uniref:glycosyltransferase family 25 protein n=1 Tax=Sphingobium sp. BS19 TaxID=3018973 RepID=UPI002490941A|nr:glycosyltransferase family 25 protein [Sphingobium sp. BS19]|tara:strand:+ start:4918 stop:5676 length:759 start_codon:yes stop_codon:yes gene_type:complete
MTVPIYLINLDRSVDRLHFVAQRLETLGLSFSRIAAVDGARLTDEERISFISQRPRDGRRGWRQGQIGCFLSHFHAWRQIAAASDTYGLVLEDDIHLSDVTPAVLNDISWIPADADIVRLESTGQWLSLGKPVATAACRPIRALRSAAWGAGAYLMSREAATSLLCSDPALQTPADDFLFNRNGSSIAQSMTTYQIVPAIAVQDKFSAEEATAEGFGSNIETDTINARLRGFSAFRRRVTSTLRGKTPVEFA